MTALTLRLAGLFCALGAAASGLQPGQPPVTLATARRIYVEQLGGGQTSDQMRDMIIAAIQSTGLFVVTENQEKADAIIKGSSDDRTFTEDHNLTDSIGVHADTSTGSASGNMMAGTSSSHRSLGAGITDNESSRIEERRHEASASIRMVDTDGDVIWSTTQESSGGKFHGAMADVADKIMHRLATDVTAARAASARVVSSAAPPDAPRLAREAAAGAAGPAPSVRQ